MLVLIVYLQEHPALDKIAPKKSFGFLEESEKPLETDSLHPLRGPDFSASCEINGGTDTEYCRYSKIA